MVSPTTAWPWRTRSAATVELSTPPLMATAMGFSSMHADSAQMGDAGLYGLDERIHLFGGVRPSQGKAHAGARAIVGEPDSFEHMRRCERPARAGGSGRNCEAAQVERNDHGFAI